MWNIKKNIKSKKNFFQKNINILSLIIAIVCMQFSVFYILNQKFNNIINNVLNIQKSIDILNNKIVQLELDLSNSN